MDHPGSRHQRAGILPVSKVERMSPTRPREATAQMAGTAPTLSETSAQACSPLSQQVSEGRQAAQKRAHITSNRLINKSTIAPSCRHRYFERAVGSGSLV